MTKPQPPIDLETSVAGEEDPGASNEIGSARPQAPGERTPPGKTPQLDEGPADDGEERA